ncbi:hypothetical protein LLG96_12905 [bacterium]|nr:hypothetical protein [bacterium]
MKKEKVIHWFFTIIAILISIFGYYSNVKQNAKINKMNFQIRSMEYKPNLVIQKEPLIEFFIPKILPEKTITTDNHIIEFFVEIDSLRLKLEVKNEGNHSARLCAVIQTDSTAGYTMLRNILLDKKLRNRQLKSAILFPDFYQNIELKNNQTKIFDEKYPIIQFPKDSEFVLHFLYLYTNDIGILYDTYYWARYSIKEVQSENDIPENIYYKTQIIINIKDAFTDTNYFYLDFIDDNISNRIYSQLESEDIFKYLKSLEIK